jgi:hypothetical protein
MPETTPLPGRWLNRDTGATVDVAIGNGGCVTASTHGVTFTTIPTADGGLATSRGSADFTMRLASDDVLEIERDAGACETSTVSPQERSCQAICRAATRTSIPQPPGPSPRGRRERRCKSWDRCVPPAVGDRTRRGRFHPGDLSDDLFRAWLDVRILRNAGGGITGLHVDRGRARNLLFAREH